MWPAGIKKPWQVENSSFNPVERARLQTETTTIPAAGRRAPRLWRNLDTPFFLLLMVVAAVSTVAGISWHSLPAEDALMLLRYARHLVDGQGITWNIGDHPVEGATDFLFLILLAGWIKLTHLSPILAGRILLAGMHLATVAWLYIASRRLFATPPAIAALLGVYLATGPGILHASNDFSPPLYGLVALLAWTVACSALLRGPSPGRSLIFALLALLAGLIRPDGVFLALFMTIALVYSLRGRAAQIVLVTVAVFVVLGGAYFLWRFHYFGYLLPNPFYKKGGGHLHPESIRLSLSGIFKMLLPVWPVFLLGLLTPAARRRTVFALIPIALFGIIWVLLTPENDANMRFQYVLMPMSLLSTALILQSLQADSRPWLARAKEHGAAAAACLLLCSVPMDIAWWRALYPADPVGTGNYEIARSLAGLEDRHYTMAVTEAGVIPYFSRWRTIDAWGLNDAEIVHNPQGLTAAYLQKNDPAIVMFELSRGTVNSPADFARVWRGEAPPRQDITQLMLVLSHYARANDYALAARWGVTPCVVHVWYVRRNIPDFAAVMAIIRKQPHIFSYGGGLANNYLEDDPPTACNNPVVSIGLNE
jgi:hypothetical protein